MKTYDVDVVGAGIVGLAHAYQSARRRRRVLVPEPHPRARGASVRNFGMLWPIGQSAGPMPALARQSLEVGLDVLAAAKLWHDPVGSLTWRTTKTRNRCYASSRPATTGRTRGGRRRS